VNGTVEVLRAQRRRQTEERLAAGPLWRDSGHVVTWQDGRPVSSTACLDWWHAVTERALGERRRFHSSRHTAATLLLDNGVPLDVVSAVLGHANLGITSAIYARPTADLKRKALEGLGDILASEDA
jgi:integrase